MPNAALNRHRVVSITKKASCRKMSAAARKMISQRMKALWAKRRAGQAKGKGK